MTINYQIEHELRDIAERLSKPYDNYQEWLFTLETPARAVRSYSQKFTFGDCVDRGEEFTGDEVSEPYDVLLMKTDLHYTIAMFHQGNVYLDSATLKKMKDDMLLALTREARDLKQSVSSVLSMIEIVPESYCCGTIESIREILTGKTESKAE